MPLTDTSFYRRREDIVNEMIAQLVAAIPDAYVGEDGNWVITFEIDAGQLENLYLAHQLLLEDMFVQTASYTALLRHGDQYGVVPKDGTPSVGTLQFDGAGGTFIPIGAEVAYDPGGGLDPVYFETTVAGTLPNPGIPASPVASINPTVGNLNGLYEYVVTFITASGETLPSAISNAIAPVNQQGQLNSIPVGGTGTTQRKVYRRKNGAGDFRLVTTINDNTTNTIIDNITDAAVAGGALAPTVNTASRLSLAAQSQDTGADKNVTANVIKVLSSAPPELTDVTNPAPFAGASEPEDVENFRSRLLQWIQNPQTGAPADLEAVAENVTGVESATAFPNINAAGAATPGTTTVRISAPGGTIPSGALLTSVLAALQSVGYGNLTIEVAAFTAVTTNVTVDVTTSGSYTLTDVTPTVQLAVTNYINALAVGETLKLAGIVDAVFGLPGIDDVVVTSPASNQATAADNKRVAGTVTVT